MGNWLKWRTKGLLRMLRYTAAEPSGVLMLLRNPENNARILLSKHGRHVMESAKFPKAFLCYGTLLGIVRECTLLPHDDDIDFGVLDDDWSALLAHEFPGFKRLQPTIWQLTIIHKATGIHVDFFRFRRENKDLVARAFSKSTTHEYRFPAKHIEPLTKITWKSNWLAPAQPEKFLAHHYGKDWQIPKPDWDYRTDASSDNAKQ